MAIGWNFPNNNNGEIVGIGEAGIETFKGSLFSSLAREICQNSLDARVDNNKPVRIEFLLSNVNRDNILGIDDLSAAVELCKEYWSENKKTTDFFCNAVKTSKQGEIRVLRISDYNTTGLTGSDKVKSSPWQDLVKSSGVSNKSVELGGSFGIGKSAPFACSDLRTIFYNTLDINALKAYQGVAKLVSFQYPDKQGFLKLKRGEITQGKGYYGEKSDNSAVNDTLNIDGYHRSEVGTDVYIIGFINHSEWKNEIVKSVIDGFLISILQKDLEVIVDDVKINCQSLHSLMKKFKDEIQLAYNYYQVLTDEKATCIREDFQGLGQLELRVLIKNDFRRKVMMARNNGMKIFDKQNISGTIQFAGVCILKDKRLNGYFRQMENPQHNDWEPDRFSEKEQLKKQAAATKRALFRYIKDKILEIGKLTVLDEMDAVGAGEFIPDIELSTGAEDNKQENINNEIKDYTQIEKIKNIDAGKGTQAVGDMDMHAEEISYGNEIENGDLSATKYMHGEGKKREENEANQFGNGDVNDSGKVPIKTTISIKPLKLRLFMFDNEHKKYKLSFTPDRAAHDAYIEVFISGEQNDTEIEVQKATLFDDTQLIHKKNRIFIGNIKENVRYSILYSLKYDEMCSMGVIIYGYKM